MNVNTFDLNLVRVFMALYRERSVSRAADAIGLSQPAMSNALQRLRRSCDDELFVRTRSGMEPTALAEQLVVPLQQAFGILTAGLQEPFGFDPAKSERVFRLLMSDVGELIVLPPLIAALNQAAPAVIIEAQQIPHTEYVAALESGMADLAIGNLPFLGAGFYQQRLFTDSYYCIARKGHPSLEAVLDIDRYLRLAHLRVSVGNAEALIDSELLRRRVHRDVKLVVTHYHTAAKIVARSDLIATVPRKFLADAGDLQFVPLPFPVRDAQVRQFWHKKNHHAPANQWLRALIASLGLSGADNHAEESAGDIML